MKFPSVLVERTVDEISKLPGIGKKSALRIALHLLNRPKEESVRLSETIARMRTDIKHCVQCGSLSDETICNICSNPSRDQETICVVESIRDLMALESTGQYNGLYHIINGLISPMDGVSPQDLNIDSLFGRLEQVKEVILALSSTMEGETTSFYLQKKLKGMLVTTLAKGVPVGGELEYADEITLGRSIVSRIKTETKD